MQLTMLVTGCVLLGQVPGDAPSPPAPQPPPAVLPLVNEPESAAPEDTLPETDPPAEAKDPAAETVTDTPPAPAPPARHLLTPPDMVAEALVLPPDSQLTGRPLTLLAALSSATDRRHRLEVIHAYWLLAETVAVYRLSLDYDRLLKGLEVGAERAPLLRAARASSAALVREAEVAAVAAQHELAALALLPPDSPRPLPADPPHVGAYRTHFDELFSMRTAPARTRLIDRTLPIHCRAIDGRASAAQAAEEALSAAVDAHRLGQADLPTVLACMEEKVRQRQALIRSVCRYNHEIADYALAVVRPGIDGQTLVGMLIQPGPQQLRPLVSESDAALEPAGYIERTPTPVRRSGQNVPTPARRPNQNEPTPARRPGQSVPTPARRPGQNEPTPAPPGTLPRTPDRQVPTAAMRWSPAQPAEPTARTVNKPVANQESASRAPAFYPALAGASPHTLAKQLTLTLHWGRTLPEATGEPITLVDCLGQQTGGGRRGLIEAYWVAGQRAAEYQVLVQQVGLFDSLSPVFPDKGDSRPIQELPLPLLRLRSVSLNTQAALHEAHAALLAAQFELAIRLGRESDAVWPIPGTPPRSQPYPLKIDAQPRRLAESWPLRRLAAIIPVLAASVQQHAAAVVEADAARSAGVATCPNAGARSMELLLASVNRQTRQTLDFLDTLTDYNRAIADYALTVLPPETPGDELAAALTGGPEQMAN